MFIYFIAFFCVVSSLAYFWGSHNGYNRGRKIKEEEAVRFVKLGYENGVKDSKAYVESTLKKGLDLVEAELNKKGLTLKSDNKKQETEKDKKIEEALAKQRKKLESKQKPKTPLKLVKTTTLSIVKSEIDKQ